MFVQKKVVLSCFSISGYEEDSNNNGHNGFGIQCTRFKRDQRQFLSVYYGKSLKYELHSSIFTYNKLVGTLTRISTVIAVSILGYQQMAFERKI